MSNFFISYSRKDIKIADKIRDAILKLDPKHSVFIDHRNIKVGANWQRSLEDNIERSDYFILILSKDAINSKWVKYEVEFAQKCELNTGMKKLYILKVGNFILPPALDSAMNQILSMGTNFLVDFYKIMSAVDSNQSFFFVRNKIEMDDNGYNIDLWVSTDEIYKKLVYSVEYRFDNEFYQRELGYERVHVKYNNKDNYKISFWTSESVTVFVVIYLRNSKQVYIIHKIEIG